MSQAVRHNLEQLIQAISLCIAQKLIMPALVLVYSGIDIIGWLDGEDNDSVKANFTKWVDNYMLPARPLGCTSLDLYAARCGIVHTLAADSDLAAKGHARKLVYAWGDSEIEALRKMIKLGQMSQWVAVQVEQLFEAFALGLNVFLGEVETDTARAARVAARAAKFYSTMADEDVRALLRWGEEKL